MRRSALVFATSALACSPVGAGRGAAAPARPDAQPQPVVSAQPVVPAQPAIDPAAPAVCLPPVATTGGPPLSDVLARRRSVREFAPESLELASAAQLLWSAQAVLDERGHRPAPSAGALYPLEVFLLASRVDGLAPGVYVYRPESHQLLPRSYGDRAQELARVALDQPAIGAAAANVVIAGHYARTAAKYGERAERYVHIEVGHAAQNILLRATALGLGAVPMGAFDDEQVRRLLGTQATPLYVIAVGRLRPSVAARPRQSPKR